MRVTHFFGDSRADFQLKGPELLRAYIALQATRAEKLEEIVGAFGALRNTIGLLPPRRSEDPITSAERRHQRQLISDARSLYYLFRKFQLLTIPGTNFTDDWARDVLNLQKKNISLSDFAKAKALGMKISRRMYFIRLRLSFTKNTFSNWQIYPEDVQALVGQ